MNRFPALGKNKPQILSCATRLFIRTKQRKNITEDLGMRFSCLKTRVTTTFPIQSIGQWNIRARRPREVGGEGGAVTGRFPGGMDTPLPATRTSTDRLERGLAQVFTKVNGWRTPFDVNVDCWLPSPRRTRMGLCQRWGWRRGQFVASALRVPYHRKSLGSMVFPAPSYPRLCGLAAKRIRLAIRSQDG